MPKMNVSRSLHINAAPDKVFSKVNDLSHWTNWSPWLIMEKGVQTEVKDGGKFQSWDGKRVGSGNMQITNEVANKQVDIDLTFLKPWKSTAKVGLLLEEEGEGTKVTWTMDSSLPFFLFWMKKQMTAFIGMDFERGLKLLNDYATEGKVNSQLEILGKSEFEGAHYLGLSGKCDIDGMGEDMNAKIAKLIAYTQENGIIPAGEMIAVYHKWDLVNRKVVYDSGIIVQGDTKVQAPFFIGELPKATLHTVRHTGDYAHLGNAWNLQQIMMRGKEFKGDKKYSPFEMYKNDPNEVAKSDIVTEISFGCK